MYHVIPIFLPINRYSNMSLTFPNKCHNLSNISFHVQIVLLYAPDFAFFIIFNGHQAKFILLNAAILSDFLSFASWRRKEAEKRGAAVFLEMRARQK